MKMIARQSLSICDMNVEYTVRQFPKPKKSDQPNVFQVDVGIHGTDKVLYGKDISIELVDDCSTPLTRLTETPDAAQLLTFTFGPSRAVYKSDQFEQSEGVPKMIGLTVLGQHMLSDLVLDLPDFEEPFEVPDDGGGIDIGDGDGDGGKEEKAPPPKCCPDTFVTPNGNLPTSTIPAAGGASVMCQPWVIQATFKAAPAPCKCTCCEYRQYVKGTMTATPPGGGAAVDVSPITDYVRPAGPVAPGGAPPAPVAVRGLNAANFVEDTVGDRNNPGNPGSYGPRAKSPDGTQDYPTDCSYWGLDTPGKGSFVPAGTRLTIDVTFRGTIQDVCQNAERARKEWKWKFNKVI